jgi:integrase/recombinase XerD
MTKQNFSVKAVLRKDKKRQDGLCPINYRVTINSSVIRLPSGIYSEETNWNSQDGLYKGKASSIDNSLICRDVSKIKDFLVEQRTIGTYLDIDLVKNFFSTKDSDDFYEFYEKFCQKKLPELSRGTQYHYTLLEKRLRDFKKNIRLSQINLGFVEKFDIFLKSKLKTGASGCWSRHKNFKAVLGYAVANGRLNKNPYDGYDLKQTEPEIDYLIPTELSSIENLEFSKFERGKGLNLTRDMFLFSCYTGLRFSDMQAMRRENILENRYVSVKQQKTKNWVKIPLTGNAKRILAKYTENNLATIFPERTNVTVNRDLKEIASLCKIKKKVHFHMSRHTFASTMANQDINSFKIMKALGHKDIRMTQRYVNCNIEDLSAMLDTIKAFNN